MLTRCSGDIDVLMTIELERFLTCIYEFLIKNDPREDLLEILSGILFIRFHAEFEFWKQPGRRSTGNLFRLSYLDHLSTNTAQDEEPQSGSATTVYVLFRTRTGRGPRLL